MGSTNLLMFIQINTSELSSQCGIEIKYLTMFESLISNL